MHSADLFLPVTTGKNILLNLQILHKCLFYIFMEIRRDERDVSSARNTRKVE